MRLKSARMEAALSGNGRARREEARGGSRTHFPRRQSGGTRASAHGTAKGFGAMAARPDAKDPSVTDRRTLRRSRGNEGRLVLPELPKPEISFRALLWMNLDRDPREVRFQGITRTGTDRGPQGLGRNRTGKKPGQQCSSTRPEPQMRRLALTQGLDCRTRDSGGWPQGQPPLAFWGIRLQSSLSPAGRGLSVGPQAASPSNWSRARRA